MADKKYGRLFTEEDVINLMVAASGSSSFDPTPEEMRELLDLYDGQADTKDTALTFPADEPLFLLRGKDRVAPNTIHYYAQGCEAFAAGEGHVRAAEEAGDVMIAWQAENEDRIKVPDTD